MSQTMINRRQFLRLSSLAGGAAVLTACGAGALTQAEAPAATPRGSVAKTDSMESPSISSAPTPRKRHSPKKISLSLCPY